MSSTAGYDVVEKTLALIKPDAVRSGAASEIQQLIELAGFEILAQRKVVLTRQRAAEFYAEHLGKPFFANLQAFMTSGPIYALVLARPGAIKAWRDMMGPTNTLTAREESPRSLRALYGTDGTFNATHGSDSPASATREIRFFFPEMKLDPIPDAATCDDIFTRHIQPTLVKALTVLAKEKPSSNSIEAITWLADYLLEHNPNKPRIMMPQELQLTAVDGNDDDDFAPYIKQESEAEAELHAAATKIQSSVRGRQGRRRVAQKRMAAVPEVAQDAPEAEPETEPQAELEATPAMVAPAELLSDPEATAEAAAAPVVETTLAMIKPDAEEAGNADAIMAVIEEAGFQIVAKKSYVLSEARAEEFYAEHNGKAFFPTLTAFMSSGPIWALALTKAGAIAAWRALMGPTNSDRAREEAPDSLRAKFGTGSHEAGWSADGTRNATHGSDSPESAARELRFHFPQLFAESMVATAPAGGAAATDEEHEAATRVQAAVRGHQSRQRTTDPTMQRAKSPASSDPIATDATDADPVPSEAGPSAEDAAPPTTADAPGVEDVAPAAAEEPDALSEDTAAAAEGAPEEGVPVESAPVGVVDDAIVEAAPEAPEVAENGASPDAEAAPVGAAPAEAVVIADEDTAVTATVTAAAAQEDAAPAEDAGHTTDSAALEEAAVEQADLADGPAVPAENAAAEAEAAPEDADVPAPEAPMVDAEPATVAEELAAALEEETAAAVEASSGDDVAAATAPTGAAAGEAVASESAAAAVEAEAGPEAGKTGDAADNVTDSAAAVDSADAE